MKPWFLYFAKDSEGMLKVGCSSQPFRRAQEARHDLIYTFCLTCAEFAKSYQRRLQYVLSDYAQRGYVIDAALAMRVLHNIRDQDPWNRMPIKSTWVNPIRKW